MAACDRRQSDGTVSLRPGSDLAIRAAARRTSLPGTRKDHLHKLRARSHPLGRSRQLCRLQGRRAAHDENSGQELADKKIRVNGIAPGAIRTAINRAAWETPEAEAELLRLIPYGRIGETGDVAEAAVWLASDLSDYVTGTTSFVDGGMALYLPSAPLDEAPASGAPEIWD